MKKFIIEYLAPEELKPNPKNAKIHPDWQIARIARSIERFGFCNPILIDAQGNIVAGHGRCAAALRLGLASVPTISVEHLSDAQVRALMLADNRIAEDSEWNRTALAIELETLLAIDPDLEITDTGFQIPEIDILIEDLHKPQTKEDPADRPVEPSTVEAVARPGDLWIAGNHTLFCGDALDPRSHQVVLGGEKAQIVFTDPPYNRPTGSVSGKGKHQHPDFLMGSGELSCAQFREFLTNALRLMGGHCEDGAILFVCMDWRSLHQLFEAGASAGLQLLNLCVWVKRQGGMGALFRSQHELVLVFKVGHGSHRNHVQLGKFGRSRTNVWNYAGMNSFQRGRDDKLASHPTVKPVALVADALLDCSDPRGLVLDPFGGSSTTLIAAERAGRRAAVIELDPHYVDVALRRFCDVTGIEPFNASTGAVVKRRSGKVCPSSSKKRRARNGR